MQDESNSNSVNEAGTFDCEVDAAGGMMGDHEDLICGSGQSLLITQTIFIHTSWYCYVQR